MRTVEHGNVWREVEHGNVWEWWSIVMYGGAYSELNMANDMTTQNDSVWYMTSTSSPNSVIFPIIITN